MGQNTGAQKEAMITTPTISFTAPRGRIKTSGISMKFSENAAVPRCNFSTLKHVATSPKHYRHALESPKKDSVAMILGRTAHTAAFEPKRFQLEYAVWSDSRRTNAYKEFAEEYKTQVRSWTASEWT